MNRLPFALSLFLFVWPAVTGLSLALDSLNVELPVALRTFATSAVLVPAMVYAVVPALSRALARS